MWLPMVTEAAVNNAVLSTYFENIALGYEEYGFVYGFSTSVVGTGMSRPANYSEETIGEIQNSIQANDTFVKEKMPNATTMIFEFGAVLAAHIGVGGVAIAALTSKPETYIIPN